MNDPRSVAVELQQWAQNMGFVPAAGMEEYTNVDAFQKICKGKTINMWQNIMRQVRPKEEILHIQKNLLLQRLDSKKSLDKDPVPGHLSQQALLASKLAEKEKERNALLESIQNRELSIKMKEKALRRSGHKVIEVENQIDEFRRKKLLFQIKSEETRSKLNWYKGVAAVASDLCPPSPNGKPPSAKDSDTVEAVLYQCVDALRNFHPNSFESELKVSESSESGKADLQLLWKNIKSNISGWGAQQIWDTINTKLMAELMEEISTLCGDDSKIRPCQNQASQFKNAASILPAKHITSVLKCINLETKAQIQGAAVKQLQEDLLACAEVAKLNISLPNKTTINVPETFRAWIEAQSKKAELLGKLQCIKTELSALKETMHSYSSTAASLKCAREELARLDVQVDHDKRQVEENLAHMKMVACKLRSARAKALAQRSSFNVSAPSFLKMSKLSRFESEADSMSPQRKVPLSSTMIGNVTADSNLSFNTTCDSIAGKFSGQSNVSEVLAVLREAISKEAKLFIKVHLETVPFVLRNGQRESLCNLMVQGPMMTSRTPNLPQRNFLQIVRSTPFSSAPHIILRLLHSQTHVMALHKYKTMNEVPSPAFLQASANLKALRKSASNQESTLQEKIEQVEATVCGIKLLLTKGKDNLEVWLERPIQNAMPPELTINNLTYDEWCKRYDS